MVRFSAPSVSAVDSSVSAPSASSRPSASAASNKTPFPRSSRTFASPAFFSPSGPDVSSSSLSFDGVEAEHKESLARPRFDQEQNNETLDLTDFQEDQNEQQMLAVHSGAKTPLSSSSLPPSSSLPRSLGLSGSRLHLMASALFPTPQQQQNTTHPQRITPSRLPAAIFSPSRAALLSSDSLSVPLTGTPLDPPPLDPSAFPPYDRQSQRIDTDPEAQLSVLNRSETQFRSFRVGWGPCGMLAFPVLDSSVCLNRLSVSGAPLGQGEGEEAVDELNDRMEFVEKSMNCHLQLFGDHEKDKLSINEICSVYTNSLSSYFRSLPISNPEEFGLQLAASSSLNAHEFPFSIYSQLQHFISCFQLIRALFGAATNKTRDNSTMRNGNSANRSPPNSYAEHSYRVMELTKWMESTVSKEIECELPVLSPMGAIFSLLSGHQIFPAVEKSMSIGNFRLATLLAQLAENDEFSHDMGNQLKVWQNNGTWDTLSEEYRAVYRLMAGDPNVEPGLNWIRGLGIHLWYTSPASNQSISEGIRSFLEAAKHKLASAPLPPYPIDRQELEAAASNGEFGHGISDDDDDDAMETMDAANDAERSNPLARSPFYSAPKDTRFELLSLYSGISHDLTPLYSPSSSTPFPLDYCLSFHLLEVLHKTSMPYYPKLHWIYSNFVHQLELLGLFHWGIYIIMNTQRLEKEIQPGLGRFTWERERLVKDMLNRHISHLQSNGQTDKEEIRIARMANKMKLEWNGGISKKSNAATKEMELEAESNDEQAVAALSESFRARLAVQPAIEQFLIHRIGVPAQWIAESKAYSAISDRKYFTARRFYLQAEMYREAHWVTVDKLIPALLMMNKREECIELLHELAVHKDVIDQWQLNGQFYLEFFQFERRARELVGENGESTRRNVMEMLEMKEALWQYSRTVDARCEARKWKWDSVPSSSPDEFGLMERAAMELIGGEILYWQRKLEIPTEQSSEIETQMDESESTATSSSSQLKQRIERVQAPNWSVPKCVRGSDRVAALEEMTAKLIQLFDS